MSRANIPQHSPRIAARICPVITDHVEPLRRVVEAVEFHEQADAAIAELVASKMGPL